jgi:copper transport protein
VVSVAAPADAFGHAGLSSSEPSAGARLGASPDAVRLTYSEQPDASLSEVRVVNAGGTPEQAGPLRVAGDDPDTLEVPVRQLAKGIYTIEWKVISATDGHATDGTFAFGVRASPLAAGASEASTTNQSSVLELIARWLFLLGVIVLLGAALAALARFDGDAALGLAASGWAAALCGLLLLTAAERASAGSSLAQLLGSDVGEALVWRAIALGLAGAALLVGWRRPSSRRAALAVVVGAGLGAIVVHVTAGHADAGSWPTALSVSAQVAHFAAAAVWLGGLAALLLGFRGATTAARGAAVGRFAPLALAAVAVLFTTGILRAVDELSAWGDLLDSGYGRAVLAKFLLLVLIVAIAARNRPGRGDPDARQIEGVRRRSRVELGLGVVAVGLAALLGTLAPPSTAQAPLPVLSASGHDFGQTVQVDLTTASDQPGPNRFTLSVDGYESDEPVAARAVTLRFTPLDEPAVPPSTLRLHRAPDGTYVGSGANIAFDGRWGIEALVEEKDGAVEVPLELDLPLPEQFVSVLDIPGSPNPPQYTLQTEEGYIRLTPTPDRPGRNRLYVHTFTGLEENAGTEQLVVTLTSPGKETRQLPIRRLGRARAVAEAELPAGPIEVGVFARTEYGSRLRGVFKLEVPDVLKTPPGGRP